MEGKMGLSITIWSYQDRLSFGVVGCPEYLPDVWELADRIPEQVAELCKACEKESQLEGGQLRGSQSWTAW
jgi:hypothetical protein